MALLCKAKGPHHYDSLPTSHSWAGNFDLCIFERDHLKDLDTEYLSR